MSESAATAKKEKAVAKYEPLKAAAADALAEAKAAEAKAEAAGFANAELNEEAKAAIADWRNAKLKAGKAKKKTKAKPYNQIGWLILPQPPPVKPKKKSSLFQLGFHWFLLPL